VASKHIEEIMSYESDSGATGSLGIDDDRKLYWNGVPVVTEQKIKLAWCVNAAVIVGGFSTLVIALFTVLMYLRAST